MTIEFARNASKYIKHWALICMAFLFYMLFGAKEYLKFNYEICKWSLIKIWWLLNIRHWEESSYFYSFSKWLFILKLETIVFVRAPKLVIYRIKCKCLSLWIIIAKSYKSVLIYLLLKEYWCMKHSSNFWFGS